MDKYEFNIKVEQMKKLIDQEDYETAMKIADTIDWKKVRNANLLSMVATVYEKNHEYQDAKDILLMAYERAPIGKRLLYKLADLALKDEDLEEAEAYYREFCDLAGDDPRQHLLRYRILKQMNAPIEQQIHSLERYAADELDEKWLYELAALYHKAGDEKNCVATCDKLMLMFGLGKYVDKAMELKIQYAPLTKYQMDLVENRDKYEEKLRAVEQSYDMALDEPENIVAAVTQAEVEEDLGKAVSHIAPTAVVEPEDPVEMEKTRVLPQIKRATVIEEDVEDVEKTPVNVDNVTAAAPTASTVGSVEAVEEDVVESENGEEPRLINHLMIEARNPEKGLALAVSTLKQIQKETGIKNPVAKITGSKLNNKGVLASLDKLTGKDLIIEEAGDLNAQMKKELEQLMTQDASGMRIILIDNPKQMEMLHQQNPTLADKFECIGCDMPADEMTGVKAPATPVATAPAPAAKTTAPTPVAPAATASATAAKTPASTPVATASVAKASASTPVAPAATQKTAPTPTSRVAASPALSASPAAAELPPEPDEEMDIDEFAQYACKYASEIDCSVTGKSMLALYERIEIMEEDGIPLTKPNAEALIEEAADKAEKPSIKGLFSSKYDKDGLLILKEEHFI